MNANHSTVIFFLIRYTKHILNFQSENVKRKDHLGYPSVYRKGNVKTGLVGLEQGLRKE